MFFNFVDDANQVHENERIISKQAEVAVESKKNDEATAPAEAKQQQQPPPAAAVSDTELA